jgi:hypothetical protein
MTISRFEPHMAAARRAVAAAKRAAIDDRALKEALADPTGKQAAELLARRLEERGKRIVGLI